MKNEGPICYICKEPCKGTLGDDYFTHGDKSACIDHCGMITWHEEQVTRESIGDKNDPRGK